ncbi:MAG: acetamidase/formamidase family protein [Bryobacteraceae bacterium]|nr:acetamidase/formamidase family protein [Bryobacteraceae bacterium]
MKLNATPTHSVWDRALPPRARVRSGETLEIECQDASGGQVRPGMTTAEFLEIDRARIHSLTGPIWIEDAEPGDALEIEVLAVRHRGWGWSSVTPGLGFLKERFAQPYLFHWQLDEDSTRSLAPAVVPLRPFLGVMGVARAQDGQFRTRPPGNFGGNLDVRELCAGAKLYLPVYVPGALFSCGDGHAAQGDGEVCLNGMEAPLDVTLRFHLHRGECLAGPWAESSEAILPDYRGDSWMVLACGEDVVAAAREATSRMVDFLVDRWGFDPVHAYLLCSVALRLRLSQVVNEPVYTVSGSIAKSILPPRTMFPARD